MLEDCLAAKRVLDTGYTCVICYKGMVLTSKKDEVLALVEFIDSKFDFSMFSACIKNIDKSSAFLFVKLGIKNIFTYNLTKNAKDILDKYEINYRYNELVDKLNYSNNYDKLDILLNDISDLDNALGKIYEEIKK